jgi:hypothetical protein
MTPAFHHVRIVLPACAVLALAGCKGTIMPQLAGPGSAGYQRANALQFDPYPLDDVAPPVAGGRPREYDRPIPEVKRGQIFTPKRMSSPSPIAVQSFGPPGSTVVTAPPAMPTSVAPGTSPIVTMPPVVTTTQPMVPSTAFPPSVAPTAPPAYGLPYQTPTSAPVLPQSSTLARPPY